MYIKERTLFSEIFGYPHHFICQVNRPAIQAYNDRRTLFPKNHFLRISSKIFVEAKSYYQYVHLELVVHSSPLSVLDPILWYTQLELISLLRVTKLAYCDKNNCNCAFSSP